MANGVNRVVPASRRPLPGGGRKAGGTPALHGRNLAIAGTVLAVVVGAWVVLRPSPYSRVANLESRGSGIIAFGDSLTAGYGAQRGEDYPTRLSSLMGVSVLNAGVSGDTTEAALARLDADVLSHDPRIVIVGLGGNDYLRGVTISQTEANLRTIIRKIQGAGAMVVLLGFRFPSLSVDYESMYERVARDERSLFIPHLLRGILRDPALKSDEIHPNARGYQLMAERISGPCQRLVATADSRR